MKTATYKPLKNNFTSESKTIIVLVAILLTAFFSSCSEDGAEGPVGPAGKDGTNGVNGTIGTPGTPGATGATGATGTANVIYSDWIPTGTLTAGTPDVFGSALGGVYFTIPVSKLTQEILDKGTVLVYFQAGLAVRSLPYIVDYTDGSHLNIKSLLKLQQIIIYTNYSDGTSATSVLTNGKWRYILVPGGVVTTGKKAKPDYSKMSYEEVCAHINIQP